MMPPALQCFVPTNLLLGCVGYAWRPGGSRHVTPHLARNPAPGGSSPTSPCCACEPTTASSASARRSSPPARSRPTCTITSRRSCSAGTIPRRRRAAARLAPYVGFQGGGVETRALGAVDLALWDLLGRRAGLPVVDLLGGAVRECDPDLQHLRRLGLRRQQLAAGVRQLGPRSGDGLRGPATPSCTARPNSPGSSTPKGIPGMKVWPFDIGAEKTGGTDILAGRSRSRAGGGRGRSARRCRRCS